jgi:SAM-dependent methyltransferase
MPSEAFFLLHSDLPREGPGSDEATREALRRLPPLPRSPRVVDFGCGPGRQTLVLARTLRASVTAVDTHAPYLEQLHRAAADAGLADLVVTRAASMDAFAAAPASIDLIWSEGAIYILGFERGLRLWRPLLAPGGLAAVTEATWLTDVPAPEAAAFWQDAYPEMGTIDTNVRRAEAAGYEVFDRVPLPAAAWWDDYLTPLAARAAALRPQAARDPDLAAAIAETEQEIDIVRRYGDEVGYVFYLMRAIERRRS